MEDRLPSFNRVVVAVWAAVAGEQSKKLHQRGFDLAVCYSYVRRFGTASTIFMGVSDVLHERGFATIAMAHHSDELNHNRSSQSAQCLVLSDVYVET